MKQTNLPRVSEAVRSNLRHRQWQYVLLAMAAAVVFVTTYMLILPAITMERGYTPQEGEEPAYVTELTLEDGGMVTIGVYDPDGCVPEGAELVAELYEQDGEDYAHAEETLLSSEDVAPYDGMLAMDIHFEDADGNEVEPDGKVYVDLKADLPANADLETVAVQHHIEVDADESFGLANSADHTIVEVVVDSGQVAVETPAPTETVPPTETLPAETVPAETEAPAETETPAETEAPGETETPAESETPTETETPAESEAPAESETPAESEAPAESETPAESEAPAETETPAESEAPAETETPAESEAPTETEAPAESEAPAGDNTSTEDNTSNEDTAPAGDDTSDGNTTENNASDGDTAPAGNDTPAEAPADEPASEPAGDSVSVETSFEVESFSTFTITWSELEEIPQEPELICGLEEHTHTDECYDPETGEPVCGLEEHAHTDECWSVEILEPEVPMGDYLCGIPAHAHTDACYDAETGELICGMEEHTHDESCLPEEDGEYICGMIQHTHTDACYDRESGELLCAIEEHTHDESCLPEVVEGGEATPLGGGQFRYEDDRMELIVHLLGGEELEDLALTVVGLDPSSEAYQTMESHADSQNGTELYDLLAFEYRFTLAGEPLDVSGYEIETQVTLKSTVMAAPAAQAAADAEEAVDKESVGVYISALQYEGETAGEPAEEPAEEPAGEPAEEPAGEPAEEPAGEPAEAPSEEPAEVPAEETAGETAEEPAEESASLPALWTNQTLGASNGALVGIGTVTETPAVTETPVVTESPAVTETPVVTESPAVTQTPAVTETDGVTQLTSQFLPAGQAAGVQTFSFTSKGGTIMALTTAVNADPEFTVQYWAYVAMVDPEGSTTTLEVIDTSNGGNNEGGKIPENGNTNPKLTYLALDGDGTIMEKDELMEVYSSKKFTFLKYPGLTYVNRLKDNDGYTLKELWVLKGGRPLNSTERTDWEIYDESKLESVTFTNNPVSAVGNTILITKDTVIRLVFDQEENEYTNDVNLFDYDIAEGTGTDSNWDTPHNGINNANNYRSSNNTEPRYAFGNARAGVSYAWDLFNGSTINMGNGSTSGGNTWGKDTYKRLSFGIAQGITDEGDIEFAEGINGPQDLFTTKERVGKEIATDGQLTFNRVGDTYTLTDVSGNMDGKEIGVDGLDEFKYITKAYGTGLPIYSNNFWPMDSTQIKIPNFGGSNRPEFWGFIMGTDRKKYEGTGSLPESDDKKDHNSYFGMKYAVSFNLTADYVGPLDYYFFGDDDMWVFLTGEDGKHTLVCDIGGVHSSVGQYVNLWDYIDKKDQDRKSQTYTLTFFYTERGASGSSCYMRFTLPSVTSATVTQDTGDLKVSKTVDGVEGEVYNQEFEFKLELSGPGAENLYPTFTRYDVSGEVVGDGTIGKDKTFTLRDGQYIVISHLPDGITYTVTEMPCDGFTATVDGESGPVATGTIKGDGETVTVEYVNTTGPRLPSTGGPGVAQVLSLGTVLTLGAGAMLLLQKRRKEGDAA